MAQDKRHDLPEITLESWREKLKSYSDGEVCEALGLWAGEFFPSVDDIAKAIHRMRENRAVNKPWEQYKANQAQAEAEGKLATEEDYARLREVFQRVAFGSELRKGEISGATGDIGTKKADEMAAGSSDGAGS